MESEYHGMGREQLLGGAPAHLEPSQRGEGLKLQKEAAPSGIGQGWQGC